MADSTPLRLVKIERHKDDPIPLERRIAHRTSANGRVTAVQTIDTGDAHRNRICSLQLQDISDTGLGAMIDEPVPVNSEITVFFPPQGPDRGYDLYGKVVWCRKADNGHEVGIHLNRPQAACA